MPFTEAFVIRLANRLSPVDYPGPGLVELVAQPRVIGPAAPRLLGDVEGFGWIAELSICSRHTHVSERTERFGIGWLPLRPEINALRPLPAQREKLDEPDVECDIARMLFQTVPKR